MLSLPTLRIRAMSLPGQTDHHSLASTQTDAWATFCIAPSFIQNIVYSLIYFGILE